MPSGWARTAGDCIDVLDLAVRFRSPWVAMACTWGSYGVTAVVLAVEPGAMVSAASARPSAQLAPAERTRAARTTPRQKRSVLAGVVRWRCRGGGGAGAQRLNSNLVFFSARPTWLEHKACRSHPSPGGLVKPAAKRQADGVTVRFAVTDSLPFIPFHSIVPFHSRLIFISFLPFHPPSFPPPPFLRAGSFHSIHSVPFISDQSSILPFRSGLPFPFHPFHVSRHDHGPV